MADEKSRIEQALRQMYRSGWTDRHRDADAHMEDAAVRQVSEVYDVDTDEPPKTRGDHGELQLWRIERAIHRVGVAIMERLDESNRLERGDPKESDEAYRTRILGKIKKREEV